MIGFNKKQDEILNPQIFHSLFKFIDYYYLTYKDVDFSKQKTKCTINPNINNPFYYGFEESGLTTILQHIAVKLNINVHIIPLYWDLGMVSEEIITLGLINNPILSLTDDFIIFISEILNIKINKNNINDLLMLYNFENAPIMIILINILSYLYFKKKE